MTPGCVKRVVVHPLRPYAPPTASFPPLASSLAPNTSDPLPPLPASRLSSPTSRWYPDPMRLGIISDVHCNHEALRIALERMGPVDELLCAGDAVYQFRFSNEVMRILRERQAR